MKKIQIMVLFLFFINAESNALADELIQSYPHALIVESNEISEKDYRIATGSVDVVNNAVRVSKELRMDVSGNSYLYRVADGYSSKNAIDFVMGQLRSRGADFLYNCEARGCGDSNSWANVIFRKSKLYGREVDQNYVVARFGQLPGAPIFLAYSARRGNGQVFLYIEELIEKQSSEVVAQETVSATNLLVVIPFDKPTQDVFSITAAMLSEIKRLTSDPDTILWAVSHYSTSAHTLKTALEGSQLALDRLMDQLAQSSVNTALIKPVAVGAFSKLNIDSQGVIEIYAEKSRQ